MLQETLRQKCIYEVLAHEDRVNANFTKWFNYMLNFMDSCVDNEHFIEKCSSKIQEYLGIDSKKVSQCVENSYEKPGKNQ
jgi:signal transduction histidine kinase